MTPAKATDGLQVGSTVWVFDVNNCVYPQRGAGTSWGSPIYREHWVRRTIVGENRASWLIEYGESFPKRKDPKKIHLMTYGRSGFSGSRVALSLQEVDDACWANDKRRDMVRAVERCDVATLRKIAALVGMESE